MAKKFTKLIKGDVVASVGGKVFRKLSTEEPTSNLITFTIYDILSLSEQTFQTKVGTTWAEFCNYQSAPTPELPFYLGGDLVVYCAISLETGEYMGGGVQIENVLPADTIIDGECYPLRVYPGGGSN